MKKYQVFFLLFILSLIACNDTSDSITSINEGKLLLNRVMVDGKLYKEFSYDADAKLIQMNEYYNDSLSNSETYQYNSDGRLEKRIHDGFVDTFEYNENGLLISYTSYYSRTAKQWNEEYQYNSSNQIQKGITFYNGEKRGYVEYQYVIKLRDLPVISSGARNLLTKLIYWIYRFLTRFASFGMTLLFLNLMTLRYR